KRLNPDQGAEFHFSRQIEITIVSTPRQANIPFAWQPLQTGVHDVEEAGPDGLPTHYKLAVYRASDLHTFLRYDYSQETLGRQHLLFALAGAVLLFSFLAWLIGVWSARRVMRPVSDLAARIEGFNEGVKPERLAPYFADDEVGQLAQALDDYSDQLNERVVRDREFNADVSHELRTPLAVIRGAVELLMGQPDVSDKTRSRLLRIERAVQQGTDLTTALLMLSRGERGEGVTDVRRLAEQLADAHRVNLANKPIEVRVEGQSELLVEAPDAILSVALGNLIVNAFKYTKQGEVAIHVLGDRVEVHDTGPGIDAEEALHLFDRGYRGRSSEGSKGAGIGLSIVRRLCELYGWRVSLRPRHDRLGVIASLEFEDWRRR
ncbi:MAG TPA: HAMP domain-containing sensor histidine kinase, partial [Aquimonas sp.]|nr:HAMP domain-containing sensor histidine kinase [Aquimonas sp.]